MVIRPAKLQDAHKIALIHVASWQAAYRGMIPDSILDHLSIKNRTTYWENAVKKDKSTILVCEHEQEIVGFISFGPSRDESVDKPEIAEIYAIYLAPHVYRKGFGAKLLRAAVKMLQQKNFKKVTLWVLVQNTAAQKFYVAQDFSTTGEEKTETFKDGTKIFEIQYVRLLK